MVTQPCVIRLLIGEIPLPPLRQKSAIPHPSGNCGSVFVLIARLAKRERRKIRPMKPPQNKSIPSSSCGTFGASRTWWSASTTHPWTMITSISGPSFLPLLHGRLGSRDGENERLVKMKGDGGERSGQTGVVGDGGTRNANGMRARSGGLM